MTSRRRDCFSKLAMKEEKNQVNLAATGMPSGDETLSIFIKGNP